MLMFVDNGFPFYVISILSIAFVILLGSCSAFHLPPLPPQPLSLT